MSKYRRYVLGAAVLFGLGMAGALASLPALGASRIQTGAELAPVPLNTAGLNPALVREGSYIVNAQGGMQRLPYRAVVRAGRQPVPR
jgi:hypothetical protein